MKKSMQKQNVIIPIVPTLLMLLLVNACSSISHSTVTPIIPFTPTVSPVAEISTTPKATSINIITNQDALEQMYGKEIHFEPNYVDYNSRDATLTTIGVTYYIRVNMLSCYRDYLEREKCLLITDKSTDSKCSMCGTSIDGAIFERTPTGWKIQALKSNMIELTPSGLIPKGELIQIGRGKYGALLRGTYSIHGIEREKLVIIAETEQTFGIVFQLSDSSLKFYTFDSKNGFVDQWGFTTKLEFRSDEKDTEYYNLALDYYGTNKDGKTPPLQIYKFKDTQYVLSYEEK
jgi:hypothetical protein